MRAGLAGQARTAPYRIVDRPPFEGSAAYVMEISKKFVREFETSRWQGENKISSPRIWRNVNAGTSASLSWDQKQKKKQGRISTYIHTFTTLLQN